MGYRSDVVVVISVENKDNFERYLKDLKESENLSIVREHGEFTNNGVDGIKISFRDIKWYSSFTEVQTFEDWLSDISDDDGTSYHYVRIGENLDDIEECISGEPLYWAYISRTIETDF